MLVSDGQCYLQICIIFTIKRLHRFLGHFHTLDVLTPYIHTQLCKRTDWYLFYWSEFLGRFLWCRRERECGADRHHPCVSVDVGRHPAAVRYRGEQGKCPFTQIPESSRLILLDTFLGYWMSIYFVMQNKERYINLRIVLNRKQNDPM